MRLIKPKALWIVLALCVLSLATAIEGPQSRAVAGDAGLGSTPSSWGTMVWGQGTFQPRPLFQDGFESD